MSPHSSAASPVGAAALAGAASAAAASNSPRSAASRAAHRGAGLVAIATRAGERLGFAAPAVSDRLGGRPQERQLGLRARRLVLGGGGAGGRVRRLGLRLRRGGGLARRRQAGGRGGQYRGQRQSHQSHDNPDCDCNLNPGAIRRGRGRRAILAEGYSDQQDWAPMFESFIELVFKYRPVVFEQGELGFSPPWPAAVAVMAVLAAMGAAVWVYLRPGRTHGWSRTALLGLRLAALAVLLFALLRPVLVVRTVEPQRNVLAVLVDGSRSMAIADLDAKPRSAFVREALGPSGALRTALERRFTIRDFEFSSTARRVADPAAMTFSGRAPTWGDRCSAPPTRWPGSRCRASCS